MLTQIVIFSYVLFKVFRLLKLMNLQQINKTISRNFVINVIITRNSNSSNFYNSYNSTEVPFDDNDHHILIISKYINNNEINSIKIKDYSDILHLNVRSLNKNIDSVSNLLSLMKLNFPIIDLNKPQNQTKYFKR